MKKYLLTLTALLALAGLVWAADIDGTWTAETQGKNGPQTTMLTLTSKGSALTGKMEGGRGGAADIAEGKVDAGKVSFKVTRDMGRGPNTQEYAGTISGSELKLTTQGRGGPQEMVFKKK